MKFLNNSVNYCEEYEFKKILSEYIEKYNIFLNKNINNCENYKNTGFNITQYIPNNNKKYYLYITKKKDQYTTMYFFADTVSKQYYDTFLLVKNTLVDFFIECDFIFEDTLLLEGYLYGSNLYSSNENEYSNKMNYLITDILFKGKDLIESDFDKRYELINDLFFDKLSNFKNLNNILDIGIHTCITESFIPIFLNNFIWKKEIISIEHVNNFNKTQKYLQKDNNNVSVDKKIVKTKTSDVFKVYNIETNNYEGLLYISSLKISKYINALFKSCDENIVNCHFNNQFQKWQLTLIERIK
jgi:hypothetical protein